MSRNKNQLLYQNLADVSLDEREHLQDIGLSWCDICQTIEPKQDLISLKQALPKEYKHWQKENILSVCDVCWKTKVVLCYI